MIPNRSITLAAGLVVACAMVHAESWPVVASGHLFIRTQKDRFGIDRDH